jgi:hypothetical protein
MKPKFTKGDKVLCIDADFRYGRTTAVDEHAFRMIKHFPELLGIYTVRETVNKRRAILLCEIINPILINGEGRSMEEIHWNDWRFIKVKKESVQQNKEKAEPTSVQLDLFNAAPVLVESEVPETN